MRKGAQIPEEEKTGSEITQAKIDAWKKKFGRIFELAVEDAVGYIRKPDRKILSHALSASNNGKDSIKFNEVLLRDIWLGGDERLIEDDDYFMGASAELNEIVEIKTASLKKL